MVAARDDAVHMFWILVLFGLAVAANIVRDKKGIGGSRPVTWLVTLALFAAILAVAGHGATGRWDGIFIDRENRISLARFQLILWTLVLVSALMTAGLINAMKPADPTPLNIKISPRIWALLGLGAFTAVAAPLTDDQRRLASRTDSSASADSVKLDKLRKTQGLAETPGYEGDVLVKKHPRDARWIDLILGDHQAPNHADVSKVQQLAFTVLLLCVYALALRAKFDGDKDIDAFPEIDTGFIALLGISHAAYLGDKQFGAG